MKKAIALMLAVCCILGVLVMGVSAAGTDEVSAQARHDPRRKVCMGDTANFRRDTDTTTINNIIGTLKPREHFRSETVDPIPPTNSAERVKEWYRGLPDTDSTIYQYYKDHPKEGPMPLGYVAAYLLGQGY